MSVDIRVDRGAGCLFIQSKGTMIDDASIKALVERLRSEAADAADYNAIYDYRSIQSVAELSPGYISELADALQRASDAAPKAQRVAIVAQADVVFGMSRMFQALSDSVLPGLRVFRDIEKARAYVGLDGSADGLPPDSAGR